MAKDNKKSEEATQLTPEDMQAKIEALEAEKGDMAQLIKELSTKLENANKATKKSNVVEIDNEVYQLETYSTIMKIDGKHIRVDADALAADKELGKKVLSVKNQTFLKKI